MHASMHACKVFTFNGTPFCRSSGGESPCIHHQGTPHCDKHWHSWYHSSIALWTCGFEMYIFLHPLLSLFPSLYFYFYFFFHEKKKKHAIVSHKFDQLYIFTWEKKKKRERENHGLSRAAWQEQWLKPFSWKAAHRPWLYWMREISEKSLESSVVIVI